MTEESCSINYLPNELISLILQRIDTREILRFGATCRRFYYFVKTSQYLWRDITKRTLPERLYTILEQKSDGNWLNDLKGYTIVEKKVYINLRAMSPQFYGYGWFNGQDSDVSIQDVRPFFEVALYNRFSYNYSIYILQEVIRKGTIIVDEAKKVENPYTLTGMHYARVVLRHLVHTFLSLKWVRAHMGKHLTPVAVCNYFIQWVDTITMHPEEDVDDEIANLVAKVKFYIQEKTGKTGDEAERKISDREILTAVSHVIYRQRHMAITTAANLDTLDVIRVLNTKVGNNIVVNAIFHAVARKCGVELVLIAFPNHIFLEWRDNSDPRSPQVYAVDPSTGELSRRRRCPFSQSGPSTNYRYCPDSLLQYLCSSFHISMGAIRNGYTFNALHLLDFLGTNFNTPASYRNFLPYILDHNHLTAMHVPLNLEHLHTVHMEIIESLSSLVVPSHCARKRISVKRHGSNVRFAVGMMCYHNKYDYVCIVRGWDAQCALKWQCQMAAESLYFGVTQPFYNVMAADQSERYVPQEYLQDLAHPTRMYHLEDVIATEFTHFDGFAYVPNDEKRREYPEDEAVVNVYRERHQLLS